MDVKIKALSALFVAAVILGSIPLLVSANGNANEWPLGKDIASTFRGVLGRHQGDVEGFIFETKVSVADTIDAKLDVIDSYIHGEDGLRVKVAWVKEQQESAIADFQADGDRETLVMEMQGLARELADTARTMGDIGGVLHGLSEGLAGDLKARAEGLAGDLQACKEDATEVANAVLDALKDEGVVPAQEVIEKLKEEGVIPVELPELPELPEEVPPEGAP